MVNLLKIVTTSLLEWATLYLDFSKKKHSLKTYHEKRLAFKLLLNHQDIDPYSPAVDLDSHLILRHLQDQTAARSGNSANKDRKNLRAGWVWATKFLDFPSKNPFDKIDHFSETRKERVVPSVADFLAVLDVVTVPQDKVMLLAYLFTGARREELFRLKWSDVSFNDKSIRLASRKNRSGQWFYDWLSVDSRLLIPLQEHQKITGCQEYVFVNMNGSADSSYWQPYTQRRFWLPNLCRTAGVKEFGFHGIRHLCASILAAENVPLVDIQKHLRHRNLTTTQRYIHSLSKKGVNVLFKSLGEF